MFQPFKIALLRNKEFWLLITIFSLILFFGFHTFVNFRPIYLTIAAGPSTAESFELSQVIAEQLSIYSPRIKLRVLDTKGSEENLELLQQRKVQLASVPVSGDLNPSIRLVSFLFDDVFQIVVAENSGIETIADLKGKRIAIPEPETDADEFFWILVKHYRLSPEDIKEVSLSGTDANAAFLNNQVDAVFRVRPSGNKLIQELVQQKQARIIAVDQAAALKVQYPKFKSALIPKGVYQGNSPIPQRDLPTVSVDRILISDERVNNDAIYEITRLLYEQRQFLTSRMPLSNEINPPDQTKGLILPIHAGAAKYYDREKPSFLSENADLVALILTVVAGVLSWLWRLKQKFASVQKNRSDRYNREFLRLIEQIKRCENLDSLNKIRDTLYQEFAVVIDAFDRDLITSESLQSVRFAWEATLYALQDQESYLLRQLKKDR
ncbi:TRAP transporter solute receptor TAXI family protein [Chondrocystis sp. NIES-4102]|nr:TRAP transporter solute receptor TAXI family protein [Chondrocystis sp. NIES-4102]